MIPKCHFNISPARVFYLALLVSKMTNETHIRTRKCIDAAAWHWRRVARWHCIFWTFATSLVGERDGPVHVVVFDWGRGFGRVVGIPG